MSEYENCVETPRTSFTNRDIPRMMLETMYNESKKYNKVYVKRVRVKTGDKVPNELIPYKFVRTEIPEIEIPEKLEVKVHKDRQVEYEGDIKLMLLNKEEYFNYSGDLKLSVVQMPINSENPPSLVQKHIKKLRSVNFWLYRGKRLTDWHYDGHKNFLYQLKGRKVVYLLPPNTLKGRNPFSLYSNHV